MNFFKIKDKKNIKDIKDKNNGETKENKKSCEVEETTNEVILPSLTKDQKEFNNNKIQEEDPEMQTRLLTLPSRAYFYENIPVQVKVRDLLVGEALTLQETYKKTINKRDNAVECVKNKLCSIIYNQDNNKVLSRSDQDYINKLALIFQDRGAQDEYDNSVRKDQREFTCITAELIDVFQKCVLTEGVNLRDLTVEDFYYICYNILLLSCPDGFSFKCSFPRYNIKEMQFKVNEVDIGNSFGEGLQNNVIVEYKDLLVTWKKYNFTPPLVKYIEVFNNNCYREDLSEEANKLYGLWNKDVSLIYNQYAQFIRGKDAEDQLKQVVGPFRKKRKYLSSLEVFKLFYATYIRNNYSIIKEVTLDDYDYNTLDQLIEGLGVCKKNIESKIKELKDNSKHLELSEEERVKLINRCKYEIDDCNSEIKEIKSIQEKCKDITDVYKMFKSKSLRIRVDLDLPSLVQQVCL